jgi:hypothetical protein
MRGLVTALVAVTLAASACGSSHPAVSNGLHSAAYRALPLSLRTYIHSTLARANDGPTHQIDVYGPGRHAALERAAMGDIVRDPERKKDFYLIVQHGQYVCTSCSGPPGGGKPPHGMVETTVWSTTRGGTDWGIAPELPASMSSLHPIAVITLS